MHNSSRITTNRIHRAQLGIMIFLGGIFIHQAHMLIRSLDISLRSWSWDFLNVTQILFSGLDYILAGGILVLLGIIVVCKADAHSEYEIREPLQDILQCTNAAATGDLTRIPKYMPPGEVGQVALAVGRLIAVLARSENLVYQLNTLVESSGEAIISYSLDGTILSWNKGAQRIYGYSPDEVKGRSIAILFPEDKAAEVNQILESIRSGERLMPFEMAHRARSGRTVRALVRASAIFDSTRIVIGGSFCVQDLAEAGLPQSKTIENSQVL